MTAIDIVLTQVNSSCTALPAMASTTQLWVLVTCTHKYHVTRMIQYLEAYLGIMNDRLKT